MPTLSNDRPALQAPHEVRRAHLFVLLSCASPSGGSSRHLLDGVEEVHLGRGPAGSALRSAESARPSLRIAISDDRVSSSHARLTRGAEGWTFEDIGSKNGSLLDGVPVRRALLADGDLLQIGHTLLLFRDAVPTPASAPADVEASARSAFATLNPAFARELDALAAVAQAEIPVLLVSETGTGKEVIARAIHALSGRRGPFVPVNCGALTASLAESILFGHKRGAFSGATADSLGLVQSADLGTLLLDELGDMPLALQPALLRVLQEGEVLPVGATSPVRHRARVVAATHRDLERRVAAGAFREDLLARIAGFVFRIPPLRDRREDIGLLASVILRKLSERSGRAPALSAEAAAMLVRYGWPRNVRELEKCLVRAALFAGDGPIEAAHLPPEVRGARNAAAPPPAEQEEGQRARLVALLVQHRGNLRAVASALRTSRSQVHRWLRRFEIDVAVYRS